MTPPPDAWRRRSGLNPAPEVEDSVLPADVRRAMNEALAHLTAPPEETGSPAGAAAAVSTPDAWTLGRPPAGQTLDTPGLRRLHAALREVPAVLRELHGLRDGSPAAWHAALACLCGADLGLQQGGRDELLPAWVARGQTLSVPELWTLTWQVMDGPAPAVSERRTDAPALSSLPGLLHRARTSRQLGYDAAHASRRAWLTGVALGAGFAPGPDLTAALDAAHRQDQHGLVSSWLDAFTPALPAAPTHLRPTLPGGEVTDWELCALTDHETGRDAAHASGSAGLMLLDTPETGLSVQAGEWRLDGTYRPLAPAIDAAELRQRWGRLNAWRPLRALTLSVHPNLGAPAAAVTRLLARLA